MTDLYKSVVDSYVNISASLYVFLRVDEVCYLHQDKSLIKYVFPYVHGLLFDLEFN